MSRQAFRLAARDQRVCAVTGAGGRAYHAHHVIRVQDLRNNYSADPDDPRNALRVGWKIHYNHHHAVQRIELVHLTDENLEFAFEVLGEHAGDYLRRHYAGEDPRLYDRLKAQAT